jgi:hypothetical protein
MSEKKDPGPIFGEKEIGAILSKALKLQHEQQAADSSGHGLSLSELQQIAAEVGVDPQFVALAAASPDAAPTPESRFQFWGGPLILTSERIIEGQIDDDTWQDVVSELRKTFAAPGASNKVGAAWEWEVKRDLISILCSVVPRGNQVKITLNINADESRRVFPWFLGIAVIMSLFTVASGPFLPAALITSLIAAFHLFARTRYTRWMKSQQRRADEAMRKLTDLLAVEYSIPQPTTVKTPPVPESPPVLRIEEEETEEPSPAPRIRTRA